LVGKDGGDGDPGAGRHERQEPGKGQETCQKKAVMMKTATYPHTVQTRLASRVWQRIHALLARGLDVLRTWQHRHRGRRALRQLDDRLLRDIGVSRAEAAREARKPFWCP
jgi:uncharacterized protein YjiS (DUF1127 family)